MTQVIQAAEVEEDMAVMAAMVTVRPQLQSRTAAMARTGHMRRITQSQCRD